MNILRKGLSLLSVGVKTQCSSFQAITNVQSLRQTAPLTNFLAAPSLQTSGLISRAMASLAQMHKTGPHIKKRKSRNPLNGHPFAKGVVLKTLIKKPKKPNSANRKCVLVRLSNGREMVAYIPGIGHNLQEHNIVLVRVGRVQDCPGVKLKCVRGKYDLPHVIKQKV
ncbi:40S ribosomal protein S12, mitochondrial [Bicyclus anynana]|uniref:Small ribosomal subunit protein uS12m n=1 Tax=Bicyclus anynana TaxID=110368 RepID=A0ABM3LST2_BICAN|nr:40S ribosomal protein S12, mitochondrial [Bicyclus anynana]